MTYYILRTDEHKAQPLKGLPAAKEITIMQVDGPQTARQAAEARARRLRSAHARNVRNFGTIIAYTPSDGSRERVVIEFLDERPEGPASRWVEL